jgi:hypothetical protein
VVESYVDGMTSSEPHDVDMQQEVALIKRAQLLTDLEISVGAAVVELRDMAHGRADLLARVAGSQIGAFLASPRKADPNHLLAGTLLVLAGASPELVQDAVESARRRTGLFAHEAA